MNIEQIKKDMDNGVMISKSTFVKLVEAAALMERSLAYIHGRDTPREVAVAAASALNEVNDL